MKKTFLNITIVLALVLGLGLAGAAQKKSAEKKAASKELPVLTAADLQEVEVALPAAATAKPAKPRQVLVFSRCEGFVHGSGILSGNTALELMGKKTGAYTADFSTNYADFAAANLAKYDAIVLNNTIKLAFPDAELEKSWKRVLHQPSTPAW